MRDSTAGTTCGSRQHADRLGYRARPVDAGMVTWSALLMPHALQWAGALACHGHLTPGHLAGLRMDVSAPSPAAPCSLQQRQVPLPFRAPAHAAARHAAQCRAGGGSIPPLRIRAAEDAMCAALWRQAGLKVWDLRRRRHL